jgi:hypothetical protein
LNSSKTALWRARGIVGGPRLLVVLLLSGGLPSLGCEVEREQLAAPDSTPPTVAILSPAAGATVADSVAVTVAAADAAGVARVTLLVDQSPLATRYCAPWVLLWDTSAHADSSRHVVQVEAVDPAGNLALSDSIVVWTRRNSPPQVEVGWPPDCLWLAADRPGPVWHCLAWDPDDGWLQATAITWRVDGAPLSAGCLSLDPPSLAVGDHRLTVLARDRWGRCGSTRRRITVFAEPGRASPEATWMSFLCALRARAPEQAADCLAEGFCLHPPTCGDCAAVVSAADAAQALTDIVGDSLLTLFVVDCRPGPVEVFEIRGRRHAKLELLDLSLRVAHYESDDPGTDERTNRSLEIRGSAARLYLREEPDAADSWSLDAWWDLHGSTWAVGTGPSWTALLQEALRRAGNVPAGSAPAGG